MILQERPSPNHGPRPKGVKPDMLVLHYTGMPTAEAALERLCDPEAEVSAHYLIEEDGTLWRLVRESRRAWHAGAACWRGERDVNGRSIGIELVNPGHEFGYRPFPDAQMATLITLARDLVADHAIPPGHVVGHSDVAPARKQDPGELFDWRRLAAAGIGLWPTPAAGDAGPEKPGEVAALLTRIGYDVPANAGPEEARPAILAFQRHWHPEVLSGAIETETLLRLRAVARLV
jgi:N-acetylmuramoyl-L-alanine amidase